MIIPSDIRQAKILIVDDQEANVKLLEFMLGGCGYTSVSSTMEFRDVFELYKANRYDLVILDLNMPHMDGFQVLEELKTVESWGYVPALVVTAEPAHKLRALEAGAKDFVSKPFDNAEVLTRVRNMLEIRLMHKRLRDSHAFLTHELNQPLLAMTLYLSGLRRLLANGGPPAARQALERVLEQRLRMQQIIKGIRDHVQKRETERQMENLLKTIEEAASLALLGVTQGLRLETRMGEGATEACIDRTQIQQVLTNLIRNAAEAMEGQAQRELLIATTRRGEMVEISLADNGPGLPEVVRAKLFQPFITTKADGMGVGLSACHAIVEAHGGELRAEARHGGGTVFRFTVPCRMLNGFGVSNRGSRRH